MEPHDSQQLDPLLTQKQAAAILGVSLKWLQIRRRRGVLRYVKLGYNKIRYRRSELRRLMQEGEVSS